MQLALVQALYRARSNHECAQICNDGAMQNYSAEINFQARPRQYIFCTYKGSHFLAFHPLSCLFICTLHWCKHCTLLDVTTNMRKFPMTALCVIAVRSLICRPVLVGTLFATMHGLHFQALHPLSFIFICILHWCKHCTMLEVTTNMRKFPMTALCGIAAQRLIYRPVLVDTLFATTHGLHFQALHSLSFLFTSTLDWCKHCTLLEVTTNVRKFPMTALCVIAAQKLICRPVLVGPLFTTTHGLHFQALHPLSFLIICTLHWCKHCTLLEVTTNVRKFPITALCKNCSRRSGLQARPRRYAFCTDPRFTFSGSPSP